VVVSREFVSHRNLWTWIETFVRLKQRSRDVRFGTWNVSSLYKQGSLTAASWELTRYRLDLVGVQEVRWDKGGIVRAGACVFFMEKEMKIVNCEKDFW